MDRRRFWSIGTILVAALIVVLSAIGDAGGYVHMESTAFLRVYNDTSRPVWKIVCDPLVTDWNAYQARELSYLVDCLDARLIYACARHGMVHFYSLSAMAILLLCVSIQQYFLERDFPKLPPYLCSLFSLAFAAAPSCRGFVFFRSAKPLTALAATAVSFAAWRLFLRRERKSAGRMTWILLGSALFLAPLADRQGAFLTACFAGFCGVALTAAAFGAVRKRFDITDCAMRKLYAAGMLGGGAVLFGAVYNMRIAPALIRAFNGYDPSFEYQNIGGGGIFNFVDGGLFLLDNLGFFFLHAYNAVAFTGGLLFLIVWIWFWAVRVRKEPRQAPAALLSAGCVAAMLLCANLMSFRHPLMLRNDVLHGAYFMPMLAVLVFLAALAAECAKSKRFDRVLAGVLILSLATAALEPYIPHAPFEDHQKLFKDTSPLVRKAMKDSSLDPNRLPIPYSSLKLVEHFRSTQKR
jgi:hypothetical protein